jgi:UDP-N-acetylglucosamine acyltransferase
MKRRGMPREEIHALRNFFKKLFEQENVVFANRVADLAKEFQNQSVQEVVAFVKSESARSFCQPKEGSISGNQ